MIQKLQCMICKGTHMYHMYVGTHVPEVEGVLYTCSMYVVHHVYVMYSTMYYKSVCNVLETLPPSLASFSMDICSSHSTNWFDP